MRLALDRGRSADGLYLDRDGVAETHVDPTTELRCSVALFRNDSVLLAHRTVDGQDDWVLPGGSPKPGETTGACARREVLEETGLRVDPVSCALADVR